MNKLAPQYLLYLYTAIVLLFTWEIFFSLSKINYIRSRLVFFKRKAGLLMSYIIVAVLGAVLAVGYWWGIQKIFKDDEHSKQLNLVVEIDSVHPMWGRGMLTIKPGKPIKIPTGKPYTKDEKDTGIIVVGKIINRGETASIASDWQIALNTSDGRKIDAIMLTPPDPLIITTYPSGKSFPLKGSDYWPRKMEKGPIVPGGISYGFVSGLLENINPKEFDKPGTSVTLRVKDIKGNEYSDTINRQDEKEGKKPPNWF